MKYLIVFSIFTDMQKSIIIRIYVRALLATITLLLFFNFLNNYFDGSVWNGMQISKSALTVEYCELNQTNKLFHQNMNTYSNLAYFFLGMIVILISFVDKKNKNKQNKNLIQQFPLLSFFFGCCLIYLCFGSAFFHASMTWLGQRIDMNATYSICITLIGISCYRWFVQPDATRMFKQLFIIGLLIIILLFIKLHVLISSIILLPLLIILAILFTTFNYFRSKSNFKLQYAIFSLVLMVVAFILRTLDVKKINCDPLSIYQGHAIWHFFTGMSAFMLYWFYRSEKA